MVESLEDNLGISKGYQFKTADKVVKVVPEEKVCQCEGEIALSTSYKAHQKIEIPPIKPFTEYRLQVRYCKTDKSLDNYKLLEKNAESIIAYAV